MGRVLGQGNFADPWFQIGFISPIAFSIKEDVLIHNLDFHDDHHHEAKPPRPFYNAFEIISSLSHGFDLRSLIETRKRSPSVFICKFSTSAVLGKLEAVANKINFRVTDKKEFALTMQGAEEGRLSHLLIGTPTTKTPQ
uniref:CBL-interacting serine/threonine-protein kinase 5 n=1 Tax=Cajanus cajan TaxID=3821 RepID=A0A151R8P2_CAJCA|nr:CBL-interacting serine/threonine-protein kinase 5 [Cajanus cajan]